MSEAISGGVAQPTMLRRIRILIALFVTGLVISGATAIPLPSELSWLLGKMGYPEGVAPMGHSGLAYWLLTVRGALVETDTRYPFLPYGTDWLAFGHFVVAIAFYGPYKDPVRNIWVIDFSRFACVLIIPYALIFGEIRHIPLDWRFVDCLFGIAGYPVLAVCRKWIAELEVNQNLEEAM